MRPEALERVTALETALRPTNLAQRVRAYALGRHGDPDIMRFDSVDDIGSASERLDACCRELGKLVAGDDVVFDELLPDVLRGGRRAYVFGQGLAAASSDPRGAWRRLVLGLERLPPADRRSDFLGGFIRIVWERDRDLASTLLDEAVDEPALGPMLPALHGEGQLHQHDVSRLLDALDSGSMEAAACGVLACTRATERTPSWLLVELLMGVAAYPGGHEVALDILHMRLGWDQSDRSHDASLIECGALLLRQVYAFLLVMWALFTGRLDEPRHRPASAGGPPAAMQPATKP